MAQKLCDLGVDIIAGSHPHVIQTMDLLKSADGTRQTLVLYSMGNFLSNQRADNISLDTGVLGIEQCADIICSIVENSKK